MGNPASIQDVAIAAGVSISTVSNVLNRPAAVAAHTRERVLGAIGELRFVRNEQAASLRLGKPAARRRTPDSHSSRPSAPLPDSVVSTPGPPIDDQEPAPRCIWQRIDPGQHVQVSLGGRYVGCGLADGSLTDGSAMWVRFDDGRGRILLALSEGYSVALPT
ncbi:LacI family DNA-binding transcriptional regulator [Pseudarthrobacter sp. DSP2-3-2b1]|uniref:LacI family DNA-binding transcriptional regulator n=1 Tax=Pseudarthrobacter sp. DSP2-3-2b1 TaxID=2804661 RepID=UPI003CFA143D